MDQKTKDAWADGCESGKYKQGKSHLIDNNGCHCVLGVLCDILSIPLAPHDRSIESIHTNEQAYKSLDCIGIDTVHFWWKNDSEGLTLAEFASYIRSLSLDAPCINYFPAPLPVLTFGTEPR